MRLTCRQPSEHAGQFSTHALSPPQPSTPPTDLLGFVGFALSADRADPTRSSRSRG
ncbi:hypothetical protein MLP_26470 [Microlunatus phosphovorus NM-1]|uniref:Uncharacterized protein n=1 Tax=Microlunatus phosphovorus (strain ATCC 700054 / DSM 10555 / JCM 9379 / NBRC 101784 / NCIMB 13414 / VKM Ac-1990 / NM-1) TaxID=1032480 RepID=F5XH29_MICPN|nr:hypothetical protein MLP_26470 [Microlunatus phosphovorus NM-1]